MQAKPERVYILDYDIGRGFYTFKDKVMSKQEYEEWVKLHPGVHIIDDVPQFS